MLFGYLKAATARAIYRYNQFNGFGIPIEEADARPPLCPVILDNRFYQ